jgi:hypothetical protein
MNSYIKSPCSRILEMCQNGFDNFNMTICGIHVTTFCRERKRRGIGLRVSQNPVLFKCVGTADCSQKSKVKNRGVRTRTSMSALLTSLSVPAKITPLQIILPAKILWIPLLLQTTYSSSRILLTPNTTPTLMLMHHDVRYHPLAPSPLTFTIISTQLS